jgi:hypothetical protein
LTGKQAKVVKLRRRVATFPQDETFPLCESFCIGETIPDNCAADFSIQSVQSIFERKLP